eukprot:UN1320
MDAWRAKHAEVRRVSAPPRGVFQRVWDGCALSQASCKGEHILRPTPRECSTEFGMAACRPSPRGAHNLLPAPQECSIWLAQRLCTRLRNPQPLHKRDKSKSLNPSDYCWQQLCQQVCSRPSARALVRASRDKQLSR